MIIFNYIMIIDKFPNFIQRIIKNLEDNFYHTVTGCSRCGYGGNLHRHGSYTRNVISPEITTVINIQRVMCPDCNKTHALIPSDLIPYFQHTLKTISLLLKLVYLKKLSYSRIIDDFKQFNLSFSTAHIYLYINRFKDNINNITYYFRVFCNLFLDPPVSEATVLKSILDNYELNEFNNRYFYKSNRYFFSRVIINF